MTKLFSSNPNEDEFPDAINPDKDEVVEEDVDEKKEQHDFAQDELEDNDSSDDDVEE